MPLFAEQLAQRGIYTVDSFDIHGQIYDLRQRLMPVNQAHKSVSIISAGWDPGSDSMVRAILQAFAPNGLTLSRVVYRLAMDVAGIIGWRLLIAFSNIFQ